MRFNKNSKSSMWTRLVQDFDHDFNKINSRGYTLLKKDKVSFQKKILLFFLNIFYLSYKSLKFLSSKVWSFKQNNFNIYYNNYPETHIYFKKEKLLENFIQFSNNLNIDNKTFIAAKSFYIYNLINSLKIEPKVILEIGAGLGNLAISLYQNFNVNKYIIIDLDEMIKISSNILKQRYPHINQYFINDNTNNFEQDGFYFVSSDFNLSLIKFIDTDLVINIDSFQEMSSSQIDDYFKFIYNKLQKSTIFININRRKYLDEESFDNNPLIYPYKINSKILSWKVDEFYDNVQNSVNVRKDPWIQRIEKI